MPRKTRSKLSRTPPPAGAVSGVTQWKWIDAASGRLPVRGLGWPAESGPTFSRLPLRARGQVRDAVWELAQQTAGVHLAFRSNCAALRVRVERGKPHPLVNMSPTGVGGLELYAGDPYDMRAWASAVPDLEGGRHYEQTLMENLAPSVREYRLYFPLYCAVERVEVALSRGARILRPSPPRLPRPVLFYGTSITQGGCADTPGSDYVNTIGRRLNLNMINLGFSGNGWGDPALADLCAEIDAALFVLAYSENTQADDLSRTLPAFVATLRRRHPTTPILLVGNIRFAHYGRDALTRRTLELRRDVVIGCYCDLRRQGDGNVHFADGYGLLDHGDGVFIDSVHPTSHGHAALAARLGEAIRHILFAEHAVGGAVMEA